VIFSPQLSSTDLTKKAKNVEALVKENKGKVVKVDDWGTKDLATPIRKSSKGAYRHFIVELPGEAITKLDREFKLTEEILRYLFVVSEK
jgi:small subunit ribosomal protein S6